MEILSWVVVGSIAGWMSGMLVEGGGSGIIGDIIVGIVGGLLAGWIASSVLHLGNGLDGINVESILVAFIGAVVLLIVLHMLGARRRSIVR